MSEVALVGDVGDKKKESVSGDEDGVHGTCVSQKMCQ